MTCSTSTGGGSAFKIRGSGTCGSPKDHRWQGSVGAGVDVIGEPAISAAEVAIAAGFRGPTPEGVFGGRSRTQLRSALGSRKNGEEASGRVTGIAMVQTAEAGKGDDVAELGRL